MSRFGTVETQCAAQLATAVGFAQTRTVAAGLLFSTRPDTYPCVLIALIQPKKVGEDLQIASHVTRKYRVEIGVLIIANSDGDQLGDARYSAWTLCDAVLDAFANFVPNLAGAATVWPVEPGDANNVLTDTGQAGVYLPLYVDIQWTT